MKLSEAIKRCPKWEPEITILNALKASRKRELKMWKVLSDACSFHGYNNVCIHKLNHPLGTAASDITCAKKRCPILKKEQK